jgi:hypothetical protein
MARGSTVARALVASDFNVGDRAHFSVSYEFCRIISECDDVQLLAPGLNGFLARRLNWIMPRHDGHNVQRDFNRLLKGVRKRIGLRNGATIDPVSITQEYDIFVYVAWSPQSLVELRRMRNWRQSARVAVLYLFELWENTIKEDRAYLKLIDSFDHVFLLHPGSVQSLARQTSAKVHWLPPAVDCLLAAPLPNAPERVIDVYSYGNRSPEVHKQLLEIARSRDVFYLFDSLSSTDSRVKDWYEHRYLLAQTIKRSRYFMAFNPATLNGDKSTKIGNEQVLPSRLFEGAAGGAIMLGTAPQCPEFREYFPWDDAVVEVIPGMTSVADVIAQLDADPVRSERIRTAAVRHSLLHHDWCYRWEQILAVVGAAPLPALSDRKNRLAVLAHRAVAPTQARRSYAAEVTRIY